MCALVRWLVVGTVSVGTTRRETLFVTLQVALRSLAGRLVAVADHRARRKMVRELGLRSLLPLGNLYGRGLFGRLTLAPIG